MSEILLRPIPEMLFYLRWWDGRSTLGPVYWMWGTYRLKDGSLVNFPKVVVRKWHPGYWLLLWKLKRGHKCLVKGACRLQEIVYEAYLGEVPNMATKEEVREYIAQVNEPYDWPYKGAA